MSSGVFHVAPSGAWQDGWSMSYKHVAPNGAQPSVLAALEAF